MFLKEKMGFDLVAYDELKNVNKNIASNEKVSSSKVTPGTFFLGMTGIWN